MKSKFLNGVAFGFTLGLMPILFAVALGMFFVMLSIVFGGGTQTYWAIAGLLLSAPWSFMMTDPHGTTTPVMMIGGVVTNLLIICIGCGVANLFLNIAPQLHVKGLGMRKK